LILRFDPGLPKWTWKDSASRAKSELRRTCGTSIDPASPYLARELQDIVTEISALPLNPRPAPLPALPSFNRFWCGAVASYLAVLAIFAQIAILQAAAFHRDQLALNAAAKANPETAGDTNRSATGDTNTSAAETASGPTPPPGSPLGIYEEADDGFGRYLRGPLIAWEAPAVIAGPPLRVERQRPANADESAYAVVSGELLLRPYPRKAVAGLLAVRVPSASGVAVMLFDARDRQLADRRVFLLHDLAENHGRHQLGDREIMYLGIPPSLNTDVVSGVFRPLPQKTPSANGMKPEFSGVVRLPD
jgi:hypothetical protein